MKKGIAFLLIAVLWTSAVVAATPSFESLFGKEIAKANEALSECKEMRTVLHRRYRDDYERGRSVIDRRIESVGGAMYGLSREVGRYKALRDISAIFLMASNHAGEALKATNWQSFDTAIRLAEEKMNVGVSELKDEYTTRIQLVESIETVQTYWEQMNDSILRYKTGKSPSPNGSLHAILGNLREAIYSAQEAAKKRGCSEAANYMEEAASHIGQAQNPGSTSRFISATQRMQENWNAAQASVRNDCE